METAESAGLLEREAELTELRRVLDAAADGDGRAVVITAPAGIGKTRLLEIAAGEAAAAGMRVRLAHASELEQDFAFGVVRQLLEPAVLPLTDAQQAALLSGAARHAVAVFDLDPDAALHRDVHATLHGLYWLLANLTAEAPQLLAVDDLQWADDASLRWLAYVARRLEGLPVAIVATLRMEDAAEELPRPIDEILSAHGTRRLEPPPLGAEAVGLLLEGELGAPCDREFAAACRARTAGNPLLVSELAAELRAERIAPTAARVPELERIVPQRVGAATRRRLARLSAAARELAAAMAVVGDAADLGLAAKLAGLDLDGAGCAAAELVEARILADTSPPRFRHPLLQSAVESAAPAVQRAARHTEAARLLAERGAPAARVAAHLLAGTPGAGMPWAVEQLRAAARSARSQGLPEQAAVLLRRAVAEPPPQNDRGTVLWELGEAELASLDARAAEHLAAASAVVADPADRAEIAIARAIAEFYAGGHAADAIDVLLRAIDETTDRPELREHWLRLEALLALVGRYDMQTEARIRGRIGGLAASLEGETPGERLVRATAAGQSPGSTAADLFHATRLEEEAFGAFPWPDPTEGSSTVGMYLHAGRPEAAAALAERMLARAREEGSRVRHVVALSARGAIALDVGDLRTAEAELESALEQLTELGADQIPRARATAGMYVQALTSRGRLDAADEVLAQHDLARDVPEQMAFNRLLFVRGELRLAQRRFEEAEADFRELGRRHERWGITRPSPAWRSAAALALLGQGRREEALTLAEQEVDAVRTWGAPKPIAYCLRARALARGRQEEIDGLAEAVALLEDTPWRLDRARARLDLGSALRRAGRRRDARAELEAAMDEAHRCGADPIAERAAEELRASGARPRRRAITGLDALTPSELRVAALAAEGRTNREIAQELFVTVATVETHLSRAYRKLGVDGRDGLPRALAT